MNRTQAMEDIEKKIEREIGAPAQSRKIVVIMEKMNAQMARRLEGPEVIHRGLI